MGIKMVCQIRVARKVRRVCRQANLTEAKRSTVVVAIVIIVLIVLIHVFVRMLDSH